MVYYLKDLILIIVMICCIFIGIIITIQSYKVQKQREEYLKNKYNELRELRKRLSCSAKKLNYNCNTCNNRCFKSYDNWCPNFVKR